MSHDPSQSFFREDPDWQFAKKNVAGWGTPKGDTPWVTFKRPPPKSVLQGLRRAGFGCLPVRSQTDPHDPTSTETRYEWDVNEPSQWAKAAEMLRAWLE